VAELVLPQGRFESSYRAAMAEFFAEETAPDSTMNRLTEYFHLD